MRDTKQCCLFRIWQQVTDSWQSLSYCIYKKSTCSIALEAEGTRGRRKGEGGAPLDLKI